MAEWIGVTNATIAKHLRDVEVSMLRERVLFALLQKKGRITYNHSGTSLTWRVRYKRADIQGYADADTLTFPRRDRLKIAELEWRGYTMAESMTKKERLMNKGTEAIVNLFSSKTDEMMEDFDERFCDELYVDGNATGNEKRIHGMESMFGAHASGTGDNQKTKDPDDDYAGIATDLAAYGGSWTGDWPAGTGDPEYDFWSPIIIDVDNTTGWGASASWALFGDDQIRYAVIKSRIRKSKSGKLDLILCNDTDYAALLSLFDTKERIVVERGEKSTVVSLGFQGINFEGVDVALEYGVPANVNYGLNINQMELMSLQDKLLVLTGPVFSESTLSYNMVIDFFGNMRFKSPRGFAKFAT